MLRKKVVIRKGSEKGSCYGKEIVIGNDTSVKVNLELKFKARVVHIWLSSNSYS